MTDEELFARYRRGDPAAFESLYGRYRQSLYLFLLRSSANRTVADDLYQESWARVISAQASFSEGSFRAWLFQIARNLWIDHLRRQNLRPVDTELDLAELGDPKPQPEQQTQSEDCGELLKRSIGELPREQQEVFLLKEEGLISLEQIAAILAVGRETVKSRLRYAMTKLRSALEDCL